MVVASGAISTVTDTRVNSQFKGITQITSVYPEWVAGDKIIFGDAEPGRATSLTEKEIARYKVSNNGGLRLKYYLGLGSGNVTGSQTAARYIKTMHWQKPIAQRQKYRTVGHRKPLIYPD